jgi:CRP-like cAMP-binding protein/tetratricopeptide (TPR) repeat protein
MIEITEEKKYKPQEIIFREGEKTHSIYIVVKGHVEIIKQRQDGPLVLAVLSENEIFGETAFFDHAIHQNTARSIDHSLIRIVPRSEFYYWIDSDKSAAKHIIGKLVERLNSAEHNLIEKAPSPKIILQKSSPTIFSNMTHFMSKLSFLQPKKLGQGFLQPFGIGIAHLNNDIEMAWSKALVHSLSDKPGIKVKLIASTLKNDSPKDYRQMLEYYDVTQEILLREKDIQLLIWGDIHEEGYSLSFTSLAPFEDIRFGIFGSYFKVELPSDHSIEISEILYLMMMAKIDSRTVQQQSDQRDFLKIFLTKIDRYLSYLPETWNQEQKRSIATGLAHVYYTYASLGDEPSYEKAAQFYKIALNHCNLEDEKIEIAFLHRAYGLVLAFMGRRYSNLSYLNSSVTQFKYALNYLSKNDFSIEWALVQYHLAIALYELELLSNDIGLLKEAIVAMQSALMIIVQHSFPELWCEMSHILAQLLQKYGDHVKSSEILEKSIKVYQSILSFQSKEIMPLGWASNKMNIATTYFLLGKLRRESEILEFARLAFLESEQFYQERGLSQQESLAKKNRELVERVKESFVSRPVAKLSWADE